MEYRKVMVDFGFGMMGYFAYSDRHFKLRFNHTQQVLGKAHHRSKQKNGTICNEYANRMFPKLIRKDLRFK